MTEKLYEKLIGKRADEVLDELRMSQPPYDSFKIAKKLGIEVDTLVSFEKLEYSGSITKHDDASITIWVNPVDSKNRQKFTVAHEIGHLINGDLDDTGIEFRDNPSTLYRSSERNKKEWKANEFAAELLMPRTQVRKIVDKYFKGESTTTTDKLVPIIAEKFGVSKAAVRVRLKVLGAIK